MCEVEGSTWLRPPARLDAAKAEKIIANEGLLSLDVPDEKLTDVLMSNPEAAARWSDIESSRNCYWRASATGWRPKPSPPAAWPTASIEIRLVKPEGE